VRAIARRNAAATIKEERSACLNQSSSGTGGKRDGGYKVVHMVSRSPVTTLSKYDEMLAQQDKLSVNNSRPMSGVVRTIGQPEN
jgi:hypothetical protein